MNFNSSQALDFTVTINREMVARKRISGASHNSIIRLFVRDVKAYWVTKTNDFKSSFREANLLFCPKSRNQSLHFCHPAEVMALIVKKKKG